MYNTTILKLITEDMKIMLPRYHSVIDSHTSRLKKLILGSLASGLLDLSYEHVSSYLQKRERAMVKAYLAINSNEYCKGIVFIMCSIK